MDPDQAFRDLHTSLRSDSRLALVQFLQSNQAKAGGLLVVRAVWQRGGRSKAEAAFRTETWADVMADGLTASHQIP
jgi:hypothetical protein